MLNNPGKLDGTVSAPYQAVFKWSLILNMCTFSSISVKYWISVFVVVDIL